MNTSFTSLSLLTKLSSFFLNIYTYTFKTFPLEATMLRTLLRQSMHEGGTREVAKQITLRKNLGPITHKFDTLLSLPCQTFSHFLLRKRPLNFINGRPTAESSRTEKKNYEAFTNAIRSLSTSLAKCKRQNNGHDIRCQSLFNVVKP